MELIKNHLYRIRLTNGSWTTGEYRYTKVHEANWCYRHRTTHYIFINVRTDQEIEIKSMQKIRAYTEEATK